MTAPCSREISTSSIVAGEDPQQQRLPALDRGQRVEPDAVLRADAADEPFNGAVGMHEAGAGGRDARRTLHPHDGRDHERRPPGGELLGPLAELAADH